MIMHFTLMLEIRQCHAVKECQNGIYCLNLKINLQNLKDYCKIMIIVAFCSASSNNNLQLFFISHLWLFLLLWLYTLCLSIIRISTAPRLSGVLVTGTWPQRFGFPVLLLFIYLFISKWSPCYVNNKPFVPNPLFWWFHSNALCSVYTLWIHPLDLFQIELGVGFELVILMSESMKYHLCTTAQPCHYFVPFKY